MLNCAWGVSEFLTFNTAETWNDVKAKLNGNGDVDYYRFNFTGRKSNEHEWYSLIPAAVLKDILSSDVEVPFRAPRTQERMGKGGILLDMTRYNSVRRYMASAFKTGYRRSAVKTQGVPSAHELRDTFRTRASECRVSPDVAEFAMGHAIDDLNYNKVFYDAKYVWLELKKILLAGETTQQIQEQAQKLESQMGEIVKLREQLNQATLTEQKEKAVMEDALRRLQLLEDLSGRNARKRRAAQAILYGHAKEEDLGLAEKKKGKT